MKRKIVLPNFSNYVIYPTLGKIWSKKRLGSKGGWVGKPNRKGYTVVHLRGDDGSTLEGPQSRIIWQAVHGELPPKHHIHHINHNRQDDRIKNLQLISADEHNRMHTEEKKHKPKPIAEFDKNSKLSKPVGAYIDDILFMTFTSTKEAEMCGYDHGAISKCCNGQRKTHQGFSWKYL